MSNIEGSTASMVNDTWVIETEDEISRLPCPECKNVFKRKDHLKRHLMEKHEVNRPDFTSCPVDGCEKQMFRIEHLRRHIKRVHKEDPYSYFPKVKSRIPKDPDDIETYKCVVYNCNVEFSRLTHLRRHVKEKHKEDPAERVGYLYNMNPSKTKNRKKTSKKSSSKHARHVSPPQ